MLIGSVPYSANSDGSKILLRNINVLWLVSWEVFASDR